VGSNEGDQAVSANEDNVYIDNWFMWV
jgi:hypothetical protein